MPIITFNHISLVICGNAYHNYITNNDLNNNFNLINNNISKISIDYIVEQGTSDDWYYRKYASGWAELWGFKTSSLTTMAGQSSTAYAVSSFPFTLTSQPRYFASFGVNGQPFCWLTYVGAGTTLIEAYGKGNGSADGTGCWFSFYVMGKYANV